MELRRVVRAGLRVAVVCAVTAGVWFYLTRVLVLHLGYWHGGFDLKVYRGAVQWWLDGRPLYTFHRNQTHFGFTYPPFAALTMLPLAWVGEALAIQLDVAVSLLLVVLLSWWLMRPLADRHGRPRWFLVALAVPLIYAMEPVRETIGYGQVNLYIVALVVVDLIAIRRGRAWAGVGIGLATAIKLTPGLFILYLALTGRRRPTVVAVGTSVGATLLALGVSPGTSVQFWTVTLFDTARVGRLASAHNQSLMGLLARLADPGRPSTAVWLLGAGVLLVVGMWRAVRAFRRGDELAGITLTGLTSCLISPISWNHHLFWVVPAVVVLLDVAAGTPPAPGSWRLLNGRRRATAAVAGAAALAVFAVFFVSVVALVSKDTGYLTVTGAVAVLGANAYVYVMVALLFLLPARTLPAGPPVREAPLSPAEGAAARTTAPPPPAGSSPR
ncbi:MAG: Alpha,2-mannosyltransferase [Frankiales bacterium]|nr:Alpha,2-mannosyltransferase [Frankiales bacterium]